MGWSKPSFYREAHFKKILKTYLHLSAAFSEYCHAQDLHLAHVYIEKNNGNVVQLQFFTIVRTHFSILNTVSTTSLCKLNCGSFFIALAQHAFIDYFFQIP